MSRALVLLFALFLFDLPCCNAADTVPPARDRSGPVERLVRETRRADYRGETGRLRELAAAFAADTADAGLRGYAHYWRGFALWRRAFNLMNADPRSPEARADLREAGAAFDHAALVPALRDDALSARASCVVTLGGTAGSPDSLREGIREYLALLTRAEETGRDNPRVMWVRSMSVMRMPPASGGGPDSAIRMMARGAALGRAEARAPHHPLAPVWGEAECHLNAAWFWANRPDPDFARAKRSALEALRIAPEWHYCRDILLAGIEDSLAARRR